MAEKELTDVDGIGESKAEALREEGFETVEDLKDVPQERISETDGVGKALAARIKADVGGLEVEEDVEEEFTEEDETEDEEIAETVSAAELSDKTPELDEETRDALKKRRAQDNPSFKRQDHHKKKRVEPDSWRRLRGSNSKRRKNKKGKGAEVNVGYKKPAGARGLHPSGFDEVHVHRPEDLDDVDSETQAVRIGSGVGGRKRERIEERALDDGVRVLNPTHTTEEER